MYKDIMIYACLLLNIKLPRCICNKYMAFSYSNGVIYYKIKDKKTLIAALLHELRHHYQFEYIKAKNDNYAKAIKKEINNKALKYYESFIEMDAYAFSYIIINHILKLNYIFKIPHELILKHIILHIDLYKPLLEIRKDE